MPRHVTVYQRPSNELFRPSRVGYHGVNTWVRGARQAFKVAKAASQSYSQIKKAYANYNKRKTPSTSRAGTVNTAPKRRSSGGVSHTSVTNALANRASMKIKGRKNQRVRSTKNVHVSKKLREKVNKVIEGKKMFGQYVTVKSGTIGCFDAGLTATTTLNSYPQGPYVVTAGYFPGYLQAASCRYWFGGLFNTYTQSTRGQEWVYFSPAKVIDAASILWNKKVAALDYALQTGNLQGKTTPATGAPIVGTGISPDTRGLKIGIVNSFVSWKMKNNSQRTLKVTVYNCTAKMKWPNTPPLTALVSSLGKDATVIDDTLRGMAGPPGIAATLDPDFLVFNPYCSPNTIEAYSSAWKHSKMEMIINAGETCTHSIQGPKNYEMDFDKMIEGAEDHTGQYFKPTTVCCMVSVEPDLAYNDKNGDSAPYAWRSGIAGGRVTDPISIEIVETYKLTCPELAGFIDRAQAAGSVQTLNLRKTKKVFANFTALNGVAATVDYNAFNEENPADDIDAGNFN